MWRNIKTLFNPEPRRPKRRSGGLLQFVRKLSGFNKPSKGRGELQPGDREVAGIARELIESLETTARRDREMEAQKRAPERSSGFALDELGAVVGAAVFQSSFQIRPGVVSRRSSSVCAVADA
jgi:hypothetical protein